jgi:hypothetical protein
MSWEGAKDDRMTSYAGWAGTTSAIPAQIQGKAEGLHPRLPKQKKKKKKKRTAFTSDNDFIPTMTTGEFKSMLSNSDLSLRPRILTVQAQ